MITPDLFYPALRIASLFLFLTGCSQSEPPKDSSLKIVSDSEIHLCDSMRIDTAILIALRQHTKAVVEPFHYSLSREILPGGKENEIDPVRLPGFVFKAQPADAETLLEKLQPAFLEKGYSLFMLDQNFGIEKDPDVMAILKTTDKYEVLRSVGTNGINYDIDTDSLITIIRDLDSRYTLSLLGAGGDWCEFRIGKTPADWMALARETYKACPDIVEQGAGTVENLASELKRTNRIFLWWD